MLGSDKWLWLVEEFYYDTRIEEIRTVQQIFNLTDKNNGLPLDNYYVLIFIL